MEKESAIKTPVNIQAPLSKTEKTGLGIRLSSAFIAAGLVIISFTMEYFDPGQREAAGFINGIAAILAGIPVMWNAWKGLGKPDLESIADLLVSVALLAAWVAGDLRSATIIPLIMVIGHILEDRSMIGSREAIAALSGLTEKTATRIDKNNNEEQIPSGELQQGDIIIIRPGEKISVDGTIIEGRTSLDASPLTGESVPLEVSTGDIARAGSINLDGLVKIQVNHVGSSTALGKIVELLREAEKSKPPVTRVLEQHAGSYLPLTIAISLITLFVTGQVSSMMAVLVVCCPCALAISAPATTVAGLAAAGRHGILIRGTAFLEQLAEADSILFDKTGTLTTGKLKISKLIPMNQTDEEELKIIAESLAICSNHPVSKSISRDSNKKSLPVADNIKEIQGLGITGSVNGKKAVLGRTELLRQNQIDTGPTPNHSGPVVACGIEGKFAGWILLQDTLRPEAKKVLTRLKESGIKKITMVSGDHIHATKDIARRLPLDSYHGQQLPHQKLDIIKEEINQGFKPVMVGDGINDALALKAGAVGIAMGGSGTDVALASSDIILLTEDLTRIETIIRLSRKCRKTITINIAIAMIWTMLMFTAAVTGFIGPVAASLFHNIGTFFVIANSGRILAFDEKDSSGK